MAVWSRRARCLDGEPAGSAAEVEHALTGRDAGALEQERSAGARRSRPRTHGLGDAVVLAGSLLYVVGTFGVTIAFNVPRNDALAAVDADSDDGARVWAGYARSWTAWNHVRTGAALAAAAALTIALALYV